MSKRLIIGIHGLNNKPKPDILREWWRAAINEGLARNRGRGELEVDFELVYWADLLYPEPLDPKEASEMYLAAPGKGPLPESGMGVGPLAVSLLDQGVGRVLERVFGGSGG